MSNINSVKIGSTTYPIISQGIPYGIVDSTSTATAFTASIPGITEYTDGTTMLLKNGVITSAAGFTIDINGLGAKPVYSNMSAATAESTIFNINYTMLFVYDSTRIEGGAWICYRGYYSDTDKTGYLLRTNNAIRTTAEKGYRYRLWFTSVNGETWVPANTSTSTNATAKRTPNVRAIDPFGQIIYYSTKVDPASGSTLTPTTCWEQYPITLGYSFNNTGATLNLTTGKPVYVKCSPVASGGVQMLDYTQALPNSADGYVYLFLGPAYNATSIELFPEHPCYYYDGVANGIRHYVENTTQILTSGASIAIIDGKTIYAPTPTTDTDIDTKYTYSADVTSGTKLGTVVGQTFTKGSGGSTFTAYEIYAPSTTDYGFTSISNLTVPSSGWNGSAPSATINITVTGINSSSHGFLGIDGSKVTSSQFNEAMKSNIVVSGIGSNYITLKALRKVPTLTIPVTLEVQKNS